MIFLNKCIIIIIAVVIGFMYENYTVSEGIDLFNDVTVELISGQLGQEVMVTLNTESISATG